MINFADRIIDAVKTKKNPLVIGLDTVWEEIPDIIRSQYKSAGAAIYIYNKMIIDSICDIVPAIKLQTAHFERYGVSGMITMTTTAQYAKSKGLLVIVDGLRGGNSAVCESYSKAFLEKPDNTLADGHPLREGAFNIDALTVNSYISETAMGYFTEIAKNNGKGIFIAVRNADREPTSIQNIIASDGREIYKHVADKVNAEGAFSFGKYKYSSVGAIVKGINIEEIKEIRKLLPKCILLVPGRCEDEGCTVGAIPYKEYFNEDGLGALICASKSIIYAYKADKWKEQYNEETFAAAARAETLSLIEKIKG